IPSTKGRTAQPAGTTQHTCENGALCAIRAALRQSCGHKARKDAKQLALQSRRIGLAFSRLQLTWPASYTRRRRQELSAYPFLIAICYSPKPWQEKAQHGARPSP